MSGRRSKRKGNRAEREFAKLIGGERIPLSGSAGGSYTGDVKGLGLLWECKARKDGFKQLYKWLEGDADALAIKADRKEWLVVLPAEKFLEIINSNVDKKKLLDWADEKNSGNHEVVDRTCFDKEEELAAYLEGYSNAINDLVFWLGG